MGGEKRRKGMCRREEEKTGDREINGHREERKENIDVL